MTRSPTVMFVYLLSLLFQSEAVWLLWTEIDDYYYIISLLRFSEQTQVFVSLSSLLSEIETQSLSLSEVRERHNLTLEWDWDWDTVWLQLLWMNLLSSGSRVQMLWRKVTQLSSITILTIIIFIHFNLTKSIRDLLAPKELYTWYCPMTIQPLFEHTPVLNNNFEY